MSQEDKYDFWLRLIKPTPMQAIMSLIFALVSILAIQWQSLIKHFGGQGLQSVVPPQVNLQVAHILGLSLVGQAAIIIFWAIVGLLAYLIVWWINNIFIDARNKIVIHTSYTNRGNQRINISRLAIKLSCCIALLIMLLILPYGLNFWLSLWNDLLKEAFTWAGLAKAVGSICGFACELYLAFSSMQLAMAYLRK